MKRVSLYALVAAFVASMGLTSAQAADIYGGASTKDDYSAPRRNWNGLWIAALGGYQMSREEVSGGVQDGDDFANVVIDGLADGGLTGEVQIGFDREVVPGRITLGAFAGYNITDSQFSVDFSSSAPAASGLDDVNVLTYEQDWGGVLGAQIGFIKSQDTIFRIGAGWAFGEMTPVTTGIPGGLGTAINNELADQDTDLSGWFVQGSMDTRLSEVSENLTLKMIVRYTDYGDRNLTNGECGIECSYSIDTSRDRVDALIGLSYTLGDVGN